MRGLIWLLAAVVVLAVLYAMRSRPAPASPAPVREEELPEFARTARESVDRAAAERRRSEEQQQRAREALDGR